MEECPESSWKGDVKVTSNEHNMESPSVVATVLFASSSSSEADVVGCLDKGHLNWNC